MAKFTLNVNGKSHDIDADPDMPLLYALRNDIGLNNPHFGCGLAQCGACTVHLNGTPVRACVTPVTSVGDGKVVTMPLRGVLGTDVLKHRPDWKVIDNPFGDGDPIVLLPAIRPDVALFHAPMADRNGNVWIGRQRELVTMRRR